MESHTHNTSVNPLINVSQSNLLTVELEMRHYNNPTLDVRQTVRCLIGYW